MELSMSIGQFLLRGIPEAFLFVFSSYVFSKTVISKDKYLISSALLAVIAYLIRFLPIQYGIHTMINLFVLIILMVNVSKLDIVKSIKAGIITMFLGFLCEGITVMVMQTVFKIPFPNDKLLQAVYGIPSLMLFGCIVVYYYFRLLNRKELTHISYGKVSK